MNWLLGRSVYPHGLDETLPETQAQRTCVRCACLTPIDDLQCQHCDSYSEDELARLSSHMAAEQRTQPTVGMMMLVVAGGLAVVWIVSVLTA